MQRISLFHHDIKLENLKPHEAEFTDLFFMMMSSYEIVKPVKRYEADGEGGGKGKDHREGCCQPAHFVIKDDINDINNICGDLIVINFDDDGNIFKT